MVVGGMSMYVWSEKPSLRVLPSPPPFGAVERRFPRGYSDDARWRGGGW
jgi:hypothetical protein